MFNWAIDILTKPDRLRRVLKEIHYANVFRDTIEGLPWVHKRSFSPNGNAATYSFLYVLTRILNDIHPKAILEFGAGQTSKLTAQYASHFKMGTVLNLVEHDSDWLAFIESHVNLTNSNIVCLSPNLISLEYKGQKSNWYRDLQSHLTEKKYDLIILDGPGGSSRYSRCGILELIPDFLSTSFVIVVDDYNRRGERDTVMAIQDKLRSKKIDYNHWMYSGVKDQYLIFSPDLHILECL